MRHYCVVKLGAYKRFDSVVYITADYDKAFNKAMRLNQEEVERDIQYMISITQENKDETVEKSQETTKAVG